ncbi:MAG: AmmeMemoRadiSam system protein A [Gammaproteobacteria bacterium]|nr:AmmeMemoRadiSam system protein A [Gammaproteobacteria bacterium]
MQQLTQQQQSHLLIMARQCIENYLSKRIRPIIEFDNLEEYLKVPAASFVTLKRNQQLRGCIGNLVASRPLIEDILNNSIAAATEDPRFEAVSLQELESIIIGISILTDPVPLEVESEDELLNIIRPNVDGLILTFNNHKATFLPSVWETLNKATQFVSQLKVKAGLPLDFWDKEMRFEIYQTISFSES